jgi:hypothetical protein
MLFARRLKGLASAAVVSTVASAFVFKGVSVDVQPTLEDLYRTPDLLGSPPTLIEWADDSEQVAFVWNKDGYRNSDVWIYSVKTGDKRQLTKHATAQSGNLELCRCISDVKWAGRQICP